VDWWHFALIALASIAVGVAAGIPLSKLVLRHKEKQLVKKWRKKKLLAEEYRSTPAIDVHEHDLLEEFINKHRAKEGTEVFVGQEKSTKPELLVEIENNRRIASEYSKGELTPFETKVWDGDYYEAHTLPPNLRHELLQAYIDIHLANTIVWLWTELGRRTPNLKERYETIRIKIADRLDKVISLFYQS